METKTFNEYIENTNHFNESKKFNLLNGVVDENEEDIFNEENEGELVLVYVDKIGEEHSGVKIYDFIFSNTPDIVWGEDWHQVPASNCGKIPPDSTTYSDTKRLRTIINFEVANDNTCFSMQDCVDGVLALAWEDIREYDDYPEDGRLVFSFGESYQNIENKLAIRHQLFVD